ncbi:hypothetical protein [Thermococcus sp.]
MNMGIIPGVYRDFSAVAHIFRSFFSVPCPPDFYVCKGKCGDLGKVYNEPLGAIFEMYRIDDMNKPVH